MTTTIGLEFENALINGTFHTEVLVELRDVEVTDEGLWMGEIAGIYSYDANDYIGSDNTNAACKDASFVARVERELHKYGETYFDSEEFKGDCEAERYSSLAC